MIEKWRRRGWYRCWIVCGTVAAFVGCGRPCRSIETQPIAVQCEDAARFNGEIHLDDAATYESFLEIECMPSAADEVVQERVAEVDFLNDAVFVATGPRDVAARCIEQREVGNVEVCADGLRITFEDVVSDRSPCAGRWSIAFALPRDELRAALGFEQL